MTQPPVSRVVQESMRLAQKHKLTGSFEVDDFMLSRANDTDDYIAHLKQQMYQRMAVEVTKHSTESVEKHTVPDRLNFHVYRAECYVLTKDELISLLNANEHATIDALHPMAKWGQGD